MDSLFAYRHAVMQIRVNDSWIEHAEEHAQKLKDFKGGVKTSNWDIAQRVGEIAVRFFLHKVGATKQIGGATTLYADTLVCTSTFPNTFSIASAGSDDQMGMISGDAAGWEYLLVLITDTNAGVATEKIAIDVTGW